MTDLQIKDSDIPRLDGKVAIVTGLRNLGGCSGIGLAAAKILASRGCKVHLLDVNPIAAGDLDDTSDEWTRENLHYTQCNVCDWHRLRQIFESIGHVDIAVANAGISQECDYFADTFGEDGELEEPGYKVLDVNFRAVLNFTKLSLRAFKKQGPGGRLVITASATAYSPEQSLPVYSASKLALVGLIRALRSTIHSYGATINGVAPAATITRTLPADLAAPIISAGAPVSSARHVGLAVAFSAVAMQERQVEGYGKDSDEFVNSRGKWNGRVILTLGDTWTEIEGPVAELREKWFGAENTRLTKFQQTLTDMRSMKSA